MSITKLSPNWACQMGPIHCPKFLLPGMAMERLAKFIDQVTEVRNSGSGTRWMDREQLTEVGLRSRAERIDEVL